MGHPDTFMICSIKRCPPDCSISHLCNTGTPVPLTIEHYGLIMFRVERFRTEGEGAECRKVMVGEFSVFRIRPFWRRWFAPRCMSPCEEVRIRAYIDCYPDRDGSKGIVQLVVPEDLDLDEMLVSPQRDR